MTKRTTISTAISMTASLLLLSAAGTTSANEAIYGLTQTFQQQQRDIHRQFRQTQEQLRYGFQDGLAQFREQHHYAVKLCGPQRSQAIRDIAHQRTLFVQQYSAQVAAAVHQRTMALTQSRRWYDSQRYQLTHYRARPLPCGCASAGVCVHREHVHTEHAPNFGIEVGPPVERLDPSPTLIQPEGPVLIDPRQSNFRSGQPEYRARPIDTRHSRRDSRRKTEVILATLFDLLAR